MNKFDSGNKDGNRKVKWDLFSNWVFANGIGVMGGSCIMIFVALSAGFFGTPFFGFFGTLTLSLFGIPFKGIDSCLLATCFIDFFLSGGISLFLASSVTFCL